MKYITPLMVKSGLAGLPVASVPDYDLMDLIDAAEADIDKYMEFDEAQGLGFAAGSRTETQRWDFATRRLNPTCFPVPVRSVTSFDIVTSQEDDGTPVQTNIPAGGVVINNDMGYLEVTSLAVLLYSISQVIANRALVAPFVRSTYVAGYQIAKADWPLVPGKDSNKCMSRLPAWDTGTAPTVTVAGVAQTLHTDYEVDYVEGLIDFVALPTPGARVSASFAHTIPDVVTRATRLALVNHLHDFFANAKGLAGLDMANAFGVTFRRKGSYRDPNLAWQALLDAPIAVGSA